MFGGSGTRSVSNTEGPSRAFAVASRQDSQIVQDQLGRPPRGEWQVARRCVCRAPQVIQTSPFLPGGVAFPTRWWLTCRALSKAVGRLESEGFIRLVNERLAGDPQFHQALKASTDRLVQLQKQDGLAAIKGHPGGGPDRVKCLHAHVAHQLITGDNPAGAWVLDHLAWVDPHECCV